MHQNNRMSMAQIKFKDKSKITFSNFEMYIVQRP